MGPIGCDVEEDHDFGPGLEESPTRPQPAEAPPIQTCIKNPAGREEEERFPLGLGFTPLPPPTMAGNYRGNFGGRFNRGGGRAGFLDRKRDFQGIGGYGDRFRNNSFAPSFGSGGRGNGRGNFSSTGNFIDNLGGSSNSQEGRQVWKKKVGKMDIGGEMRREAGPEELTIDNKGNGSCNPIALDQSQQQQQLLSTLLS